MKRAVTRLILAINVIVWIVISSINYIGIMQQLREQIMKVFLWSIFTVILYVVIIYSVTLQLKRILLLYQFRDYKLKYISNKAFTKQILFLVAAVIYLYGLCYYSANFIGLIPVFIFFSKELMIMGRFYVYIKGQLYMIEDLSKDYAVLDFDIEQMKLVMEEIAPGKNKTLDAAYKMDIDEMQFLSRFFVKKEDKLETDEEPMQNII